MWVQAVMFRCGKVEAAGVFLARKMGRRLGRTLGREFEVQAGAVGCSLVRTTRHGRIGGWVYVLLKVGGLEYMACEVGRYVLRAVN